MWETKNKANQIFNKTPKDDPRVGNAIPDENERIYGVPRYNLYTVTDPDTNKYGISLEIGVPSLYREKFIAAAFANDVKVPQSDAVFSSDVSQPAQLQFAHPASSPNVQDFAIRVGFDANGNQLLDPSEATVKMVVINESGVPLKIEGSQTNAEPTVHGSNAQRYNDSESNLDVWIIDNATGVLPHATRMLQIFLDGTEVGLPEDKKPSSTNSSISLDVFSQATAISSDYSEWLTHNSGAAFNDKGITNSLKEYVWESDKSLSNLAAQAAPLKIASLLDNPHDKINQFFVDSVLTVASQHFNGKPLGSTATFPLSSSSEPFYEIDVYPHGVSWLPPTSFEVSPSGGGDGSILSLVDDANGSIGRARLTSSGYQFNCTKVNIGGNISVRVDSIRVIGELEDLYDFNIEAGFAGAWAATLQIGHGNGSYGPTRQAGMIYRSLIKFDTLYDIFPVIHPLQ